MRPFNPDSCDELECSESVEDDIVLKPVRIDEGANAGKRKRKTERELHILR